MEHNIKLGELYQEVWEGLPVELIVMPYVVEPEKAGNGFIVRYLVIQDTPGIRRTDPVGWTWLSAFNSIFSIVATSNP